MSKTTLTNTNKVTLLQVKSKLWTGKARMFGMTSPFFWNWKGLEKRGAKNFRQRVCQSSLTSFDIKRLILYLLAPDTEK